MAAGSRIGLRNRGADDGAGERVTCLVEDASLDGSCSASVSRTGGGPGSRAGCSR